MDANAAAHIAATEVMKRAEDAVSKGGDLAPCEWFNPLGRTCESCTIYEESGEGVRCFSLFFEDVISIAALIAAQYAKNGD